MNSRLSRHPDVLANATLVHNAQRDSLQAPEEGKAGFRTCDPSYRPIILQNQVSTKPSFGRFKTTCAFCCPHLQRFNQLLPILNFFFRVHFFFRVLPYSIPGPTAPPPAFRVREFRRRASRGPQTPRSRSARSRSPCWTSPPARRPRRPTWAPPRLAKILLVASDVPRDALVVRNPSPLRVLGASTLLMALRTPLGLRRCA